MPPPAQWLLHRHHRLQIKPRGHSPRWRRDLTPCQALGPPPWFSHSARAGAAEPPPLKESYPPRAGTHSPAQGQVWGPRLQRRRICTNHRQCRRESCLTARLGHMKPCPLPLHVSLCLSPAPAFLSLPCSRPASDTTPLSGSGRGPLCAPLQHRTCFCLFTGLLLAVGSVRPRGLWRCVLAPGPLGQSAFEE